MYKTYEYNSVFAQHISSYISTRRNAGFIFNNQAYWLYRFDQFCVGQKIIKPVLTKELFESWAMLRPTETKTTQNNRLTALRTFSIYLNTMGIQSYIPHILPKREKNVPYLMDDTDIYVFFEQVDSYYPIVPSDAFQRLAIEYRVIFRLIYCCGLRNSEACSLKKADVDVENGRLTIIHSKGDRDRIVYLSEDMRILCSHYLKWIQKQENVNSDWFFPARYPQKHIPKTSLDRKFNEFWNKTEIYGNCDKKPTVHSLRHAFVIKRMNVWMENDIDFQVMMPYLSSYLGHKSPMETYYYYHQVEETFKTVRRKDKISASVIPEVDAE